MDWVGIAVIVVIVLACPIGMHLMMRLHRFGSQHGVRGNSAPPPPGESGASNDRPGSTRGLP